MDPSKLRKLFSPIFYLNILFLITLFIGLEASRHIAPGPTFNGPVLGNRLLAWDGRWYFDIALNGYRWDPMKGEDLLHFQNVAFFPLYPLIERLVIKISGSFNPILLIIPGLIFGLWSNVAFNRLATSLLPGRSAFWATVYFVFWPASCFLLMGYPTGLINLCAIACLHNYIEGRRFRASLWCGIGTAAAPTMVFVALALCSHVVFKWLKARMPVNEIPTMILFGLLSVSGLILFMGYLLFEFHDPFAFVKAQSAWGKTPAFFEHFLRLFDPIWYFLVFMFISHAVTGILHHHFMATVLGRGKIDTTFQYTLDFFVLCLSIFAVVRAFRHFKFKEIPLAGSFVVFGYLWFFATTSIYFYNGIRLFYPAIVILLSLGDWAAASMLRRYILAGLFMVLGVIEMALVGAGYAVL